MKNIARAMSLLFKTQNLTKISQKMPPLPDKLVILSLWKKWNWFDA